jgi:Putative papain-like cysteine peptidase (DUF1796)/Nodulation protein Z (NodZ)
MKSIFKRFGALDYQNNDKKAIFVLFALLITMQHSFAIEIVSIGEACNVARAARHNNLRTIAYPFDWMIVSMNALTMAFKDDFANILIPDQMYESADKKSVVDGYGLIYIHDFPTIKYPVAPEDGEIMPVHELVPHWRDSISIVQAKFKRRLKRLLNLLNTGTPVALVRYNKMDCKGAQQFIDLLTRKYPHAKVALVVIGNTEEFKQPWNLPHIYNFYIDEKDFRAWDGQAWAEIMYKIANLSLQGWSDSEFQNDGSYILTLPLYNPGFFSVFNTVLGALDYYDRGIISGLRIDFENNGWYFDQDRGSNWWNYYFEPISLGKNNNKEEEQYFPTYQKIIFAYESQFEMSRERAHELIEKYVKIRSHIKQQVDDLWKQEFTDNLVIGIHYRGTDKLEAEPVSYEKVVDDIKTVIANQTEKKSIKIFAATDDARFAQYIKKQFPDQIIMRDVLRSDNAMGIHMRSDLAPYKKGEDALIDCLLLSRCSVLIKMASNLSDCSLQFNPNMSVIRLNKSFSE